MASKFTPRFWGSLYVGGGLDPKNPQTEQPSPPAQFGLQVESLAQRALLLGQQGSALIATIIAMTVLASLGTAIYSFTSSSARTQIAAMNDSKAYYLAESGGHYGIKRLVDCEQQTGGCTTRTALLAELAAAPFVVSNAGQFTLQAFTYDGAVSPGYGKYGYVSTGSPADLSISRSINYIIKVPTAAGVNIPFDGSGTTLNANNWNVSGKSSLDTTNKKVTLNDASSPADTQVSLDWSNVNSTLPNLLEVWNEANGLMSYEAQIKVKLGSSHDVMAGLSFRLKTQGDTNIANDSFYGLSYLWCYDGNDLSTFCGSDSSKTSIVLWKQASNGARTIIGKQLASTVSSSLVDSDSHRLNDWATLVVRVQEQYNPDTAVRENLIYAFAGSPNINPKGTIHWDYTKYSAIQWGATSFTGIDCSGGLKTFVSDSTFLTTNFDTQPQDEIGLHTIGRDKGELADLALRFNYNGGKPATCVNAATAGTIALTSASYSVNENGGTATITARRSGGAIGAVGVNYATTTGGTATAGADYTTTSGTLSWANGDTADKTFTIAIIDDTAFEVNETVNLAITSVTGGATLGSPNTAVLTIIDNDGINVLNGFPTSALASGTTSLSGSFTTSAGSNRLLVCSVSSELGSENTNYSVTGTYGGQSFTTITRTNGSYTRQHVWLGYVNEAGIAARSNDTIAMTITAGSTPTGSNMYCGSYTGVDQAFPVAGSRTNVNSGSSTVSFGGNVAVSVGGRMLYSLAANGASSTPPSGYTEHWDQALNGYSQSGGSKRITVTGSENPTWSLNTSERWGLAVASLNPAAGYGNPGTIALSASTYSVAENGGSKTITASRTGGATGAVGVSYATSNGTATAGTDYTAASGTLSWANGDTVDKSFPVSIIDDTAYEGDETVNLAITSPTGGATLGTPSTAVLTITENDAPVGVGTDFSSTNIAVASTNTTALNGTFTVAAGANRLLLVALHYETTSSSDVITVNATYGGQALTQIQRIDGTRDRVWVGYLKETGITAATNTTVAVTMSANTGSATLKAGSFTGVNQTTPINHSLKNASDTTASSYNFGGTALSVINGGRAIFFNTFNTPGTTQNTVSGYTERYDHNDGSSTSAGFVLASAYKPITANGTENPTINISSSQRYGVIAVSLQP